MPSARVRKGSRKPAQIQSSKIGRVVPRRTSHAHPEHGDEHIGAKEEQVAPTLPPRGDDDEPKQG
jgi:hypothetical protein